MSEDINYLRLGDRTFAVTEVQGEKIDIDAELKEFYKAKEESLATQFGSALIDNALEEWQTQINHLQKYDTRGIIAVKQADYNKLVMAFNGSLCFCRIVMYSPIEATTDKGYLTSRLGWNPDDLHEYPNDEKLILTLKPSYSIPLVLVYDKRNNRMYTPKQRTFHTMGGHSVCTGNYSARDFWALNDEDLTTNMNRINTFSPAIDHILINGVEHTLRSVISKDNTTSIRVGGNGQWRT